MKEFWAVMKGKDLDPLTCILRAALTYSSVQGVKSCLLRKMEVKFSQCTWEQLQTFKSVLKQYRALE